MNKKMLSIIFFISILFISCDDKKNKNNFTFVENYKVCNFYMDATDLQKKLLDRLLYNQKEDFIYLKGFYYETPVQDDWLFLIKDIAKDNPLYKYTEFNAQVMIDNGENPYNYKLDPSDISFFAVDEYMKYSGMEQVPEKENWNRGLLEYGFPEDIFFTTYTYKKSFLKKNM